MKGLLKRVAALEAKAHDTALDAFSDDDLEAMLLENMALMPCAVELTGAVAARDWTKAIKLMEAMECEIS